MVGFQNVAQYANTANLLQSEWGTIRNIRFLLSSVGSITPNASANGQDIYNIFLPGQESYDMVDLDGLMMAHVKSLVIDLELLEAA